MEGKIHLKGMVFYGHHGCYAEETEKGQRFVVDLVLVLDTEKAAASDSLADTVDYARVFEACRAVVEGKPVKLLESVCERILEAVLDQFEPVLRAEVRVMKPAAPMPGVLDYVAVEASRDRLHRPGK